MRTRIGFAALLLVAACAAQGPSGDDFVPGRLLVQRRAGVDSATAHKAVRAHGGQVESEIAALRTHVIRVPEQALDHVRAALEKNKNFEVVEQDGLAHGEAMPSDPYITSQWHVYKVDMPNAWLTPQGSVSVPIAVVDSGVDAKHPDLAGKVLPGWSFLTNSSDTRDVLGHGTKVAGSAAATTNNGIGVAGVAPRNPVMPLVVLNSANSASYSNIARAIMYAADRGVRVINISITGNSASYTLQSAVNYAWDRGSLVIAAAGNNARTTPGYPAACERVLAVGATDSADGKAAFSNYGSWVDLMAPGVSIYTTLKGGGYAGVSGTSFSSPVTAGVAALMLSVKPGLSAQALSSLLTLNADDLGARGSDPVFGYGRLNAYRAVTAAANY